MPEIKNELNEKNSTTEKEVESAIDVKIVQEDNTSDNIETGYGEREDDSDNEDYLSYYSTDGFSDAEPELSKAKEVDAIDEDNDEFDREEQESVPDSIPVLIRQVPSKKVAKRLNESMIYDYGFTPSDIIKWDTLHKYKNTHRVLKARVIKCVTKKTANREIIAAYCQIPGFEKFPMLVGIDYLDAPYAVIEGSRENKIKYIERLIGAQINIVIEELFAKQKNGLANRALANYFLRRKYFRKGFYAPGRKEKTIVGEGTVVNDAQIITVYELAIRCEVFGANTVIPVEDLRYDLITSCFKEYHIGERIALKIKDIRLVNDDNCSVIFHASVKDLLSDDASLALEEAEIGEFCLAKVVRISYNSGRILCKSMTGYNCVVRSVTPYIKELRPNSTVKARLVSKDEKSHLGIVDLIDIIEI